MKSVLISIKPKWCELIADGKKTIEVRKTRPTIKTPFKCYIYCTQGTALFKLVSGLDFGLMEINGKVIGEFICRYVSHSNEYLFDEKKLSLQNLLKRSCMTFEELNRYRGDKNIYAWDISDLKIYDKPKELWIFRSGEGKLYYCRHSKKSPQCKDKCLFGKNRCLNGLITDRLTHPPQSWCYVEELED